MKHLLTTIRITIFFTILLGIIYPGIVTILSQGIFNRQANGSLILKDGKVVGSELIAQKFEGAKYFWQRPSAVDYNPLPSGGSNLSQNSSDLKKGYGRKEDKAKSNLFNN